MPAKKLLSIAEIARELGIPESTLHYWKNRFAQHLPSVGQNRQKRFKPEAVEVFKTISEMLGQGHTAKDVMAQLSRDYPVNVSPVGAMTDTSAPVHGFESPAQIGAAIGAEIAKAIMETLRAAAPNGANGTNGTNGNGKVNGNGKMEALGNSLALASSTLEDQSRKIDGLASENTELKDKMGILEAELIRLRRDRRELERFFLDKLKSVAK